MPLIFAVLAIIVLFVVIGDKNKEEKLHNANFAKSNRKTNAILEQKLVDKYMKTGLCLRESINEARKELIIKGFEPCIPESAYGGDINGKNILLENEETSCVQNPERFDSETVKRRRELLSRNNINATDENIYTKYPKNYIEYVLDLKRTSLAYQTIQKGKWFTHPRYGTCEVVDYSYSPNGTSGVYVARVVATGEIVRTIKIGDSQIRNI